MDPVTWLMLAAVALALVVMAGRRWRWPGLRRRGPDGVRLAQAARAAHGARRCIKTMELMEVLTEAGDGPAIAAAWAVLELPLLEALPDCPPDLKFRLITACEAAAATTAHRDTAKGLMAVRNSLVH